jgi:hypothetical protein
MLSYLFHHLEVKCVTLPCVMAFAGTSISDHYKFPQLVQVLVEVVGAAVQVHAFGWPMSHWYVLIAIVAHGVNGPPLGMLS